MQIFPVNYYKASLKKYLHILQAMFLYLLLNMFDGFHEKTVYNVKKCT